MTEEILYSENDYMPTEQDILDSLQPSFKDIISGKESKVNRIIKTVLNKILPVYRYKKFTNYDTIVNKVFNKILKEYYLYPYLQDTRKIISKPQLYYEFKQYILEQFKEYINTVINNFNRKNVEDSSEDSSKNSSEDIHKCTVTDTNTNTSSKNNDENDINELLNITEPSQLLEIEDNIGDTIQLSKYFNINYQNRTNAFIAVNGEIYISDSINKYHQDLMTLYLNEHNITDKKFFDTSQLLKNKVGYARGQIYNTIVLIEKCVNITPEQAKNWLSKECRGCKIYNYIYDRQTIKRLAKKI